MAAISIPNPLKTLDNAANIVKPIIGLLVAAVIFFVLRTAYIKYKRRKVGIAVDINENQLYTDKNYDNFAKLISDTFDDNFEFSSTMESTAETIMSLNDDELKFVNNRYRVLYGGTGRSMLDALNDFYLCNRCVTLKALRERVKRLGLA